MIPEILIEWLAVPNANGVRRNFMPVIRVNGRESGHTFGDGYERDRAEELARSDALAEAGRHVGDWSVTIRKGRRARSAGIPTKVTKEEE